MKFTTLLILLSSVSFSKFANSESSWDYHRDKKSVIITFSDAEYIASTRHIRIENRSCPDLNPQKLLPNDPDGARAIGGIHNRHDPVLRMLLSCETVPSLDITEASCPSHPNIDLFVWQPDFGFYTHGTLSFYTWLHDYISPLLHAVHMSDSTVAKERALLVIHHSHKHRHPGKHHSSLGAGRRALLNSMFGGGVYTLGNQEGVPMMPQDDCMRVRKLVLGAGKPINMQDLPTKRRTIELIREAGFTAVGVEPPKSLHQSNQHRQVMHIIAPHQHRFVHHHHHNKHHLLNPEKDNSYMMERFNKLEDEMTKWRLHWQPCCHLHDLKQNPEYEERDRTTSLKALKEAITIASKSTFFVGSNTPGMIYCLWGPEGAGTVEFSPTGPHDGTHYWKLCGWALNGSYMKVSVPRPLPHQVNTTTVEPLIARTTNCSMLLMTSTLRQDKPSKQLPKVCRSVPEEEDETLLCPPNYIYENHRFNNSVGDLCVIDNNKVQCPKTCSVIDASLQCIAGNEQHSETSPILFNASSTISNEPPRMPCRALQVLKDKAKISNSGSIIGAAYWNPDGLSKEGIFDRIAPEWHNGNQQVVPDHPKPYRKGAFKPVTRAVAHQRGCYQTLASARIHKAMWCPQGAGDMTAG